MEPSVVYEAWCSQRPGGIIAMIEEMHDLYREHQAHTTLAADPSDWRLLK